MEETTTMVAVGGTEYKVTVNEAGEAETACASKAVVLEGWGGTTDVHIKPSRFENVAIVPQFDEGDFCAFFDADDVADSSPTHGAGNTRPDYDKERCWYFTNMTIEQV